MGANESPRVRPLTRKEIERRASDEVNDFCASQRKSRYPLDVIRMLLYYEKKGEFELGVEPLAGTKAGEYRPEENLVVISEATYRAAQNGDGDARETVTHEIGHALLHGDQLRVVAATGASVARIHHNHLPQNENPEWQADTFSAAVLMPKHKLLQLIQFKNPDPWVINVPVTIHAMKETFGVSHSTAMRRLSDLMRSRK